MGLCLSLFDCLQCVAVQIRTWQTQWKSERTITALLPVQSKTTVLAMTFDWYMNEIKVYQTAVRARQWCGLYLRAFISELHLRRNQWGAGVWLMLWVHWTEGNSVQRVTVADVRQISTTTMRRICVIPLQYIIKNNQQKHVPCTLGSKVTHFINLL